MQGWLVLILAAIVAGTAISSKPDHSTFPEVLTASFDTAFGQPQQFANKRLTRSISDLKCSTAPDGCKALIAEKMTVDYEDVIIANNAGIMFDGYRVARCIGAANTWFCFDG